MLEVFSLEAITTDELRRRMSQIPPNSIAGYIVQLSQGGVRVGRRRTSVIE